MTEAQYFAIKDRASRRLLALPHVNAVGLGGREKNGQPTGEIVLKVFVTRKKPAGDLPADDLIPASIEGVPTDVVEMGPLVRTAIVPGAKVPVPDQMDETYTMPLQVGVAIVVDAHTESEGTMGCLLRDRTDDTAVYALTNYHVAANDDGKLMLSWRVLQRKEPEPSQLHEPFGTAAGGAEDHLRDAAVFRLDPAMKWLPAIRDLGFVKGTHTVTIAEAALQTYQVRKRGARSGVTGGVVIAVGADGSTDGTYHHNAIAIRPNPDPASATQRMIFGDHGDSGSAVINDSNEVVGLHYAADVGDGLLLNGFSIPIAAVLAQFKAVEGLDLDVAVPDPALDLTEAAQTQTVPPVAGAPLLPAPQQIARGDAAYYRPIMAGSQLMPAPMLGAPNAATLGCIVTDADDSDIAYALTCYDSLTANGTIPPTSATALGQPDNHSSISGCCSNTIAHFTTGGPDKGVPPVALVKLKDDQKWLPEILRIGVIPPNIPPQSTMSSVRKHGAETRLTGGQVIAVGGLFGTLPSGVRADAIVIRPNPNPKQPNSDLCFSQRGDRGAVVVNDYNQVLGLLYDELDIPDAQGHHLIHGVAMPIQNVLDALKDGAGVEVTLAGANTVGEVQTTRSRTALPEALIAPAAGPPSGADEGGVAAVPETVAGRWLAAAWATHQAELRRLIASNRKVAAIWHRSGGPALLQALARVFRIASARFPALVNGTPTGLSIDWLAKTFSRYGSQRLAHDLTLLRSFLPPVEGLSGHELLATVDTAFTSLGLEVTT